MKNIQKLKIRALHEVTNDGFRETFSALNLKKLQFLDISESSYL